MVTRARVQKSLTILGYRYYEDNDGVVVWKFSDGFCKVFSGENVYEQIQAWLDSVKQDWHWISVNIESGVAINVGVIRGCTRADALRYLDNANSMVNHIQYYLLSEECIDTMKSMV